MISNCEQCKFMMYHYHGDQCYPLTLLDQLKALAKFSDEIRQREIQRQKIAASASRILQLIKWDAST